MNEKTVSQPVQLSQGSGGSAWIKRLTSLEGLVVLAIIGATAQRFVLAADLPLWLDETWTAMIASEPTWRGFWREAWLDVNAPLYYVFMKFWIGIAGDSNAVLRAPSFVFLYAAAILPLVWRAHGVSRETALVWAALVLLWQPGFAVSVDARSYGLLLFLSMAGAIAFCQVWTRFSTLHLLLWASIGSLQMLTHYFAYFIVAVQGVMLLYRWREDLILRGYALVPFALPFVWTFNHMGRLSDYARPDVAWYDTTDPLAAVSYSVFTFGSMNIFFAVVLSAALVGAFWKSNWSWNLGEKIDEAPEASKSGNAAFFAAISSIVALVVILITTTFVASLTERYLISLVPTMLLAIALLASRMAQANVAYKLVLGVYAAFALSFVPINEDIRSRASYGYEQGSDFVAQHELNHLIFVWDHPAAKILDLKSLEKIGGFFLRRDADNAKVTALQLNASHDPNKAIEETTTGAGTGVVWLYDESRFSAAAEFPPTLGTDDRWTCKQRRLKSRNRAGEYKYTVGLIACIDARTRPRP